GPAPADGPSGTIDMSKLPSTISVLEYITAAAGAVTIDKQTNSLVVNTFDNGGVQTLTVKGPAGLSDSLSILVGNATAGHGNASIGAITVTGDELFTLSTAGGTLAVDQTGLVTLTPTLPGGHQSVSIAGTTTLRVGDTGAFLGAIQEVNA